ncbi:MAG TPA: MFS transporter [Phenylobacterium sp.]|jgi:MFS family permease
MAVADATVGAKPIRAGMGALVVPLLALMVFVNYVDRGNFGTAAPLIKDELHLSAGSIGILTSAFFWSYTPCQLLAGWLTERFSPYRVLAVGLAMWSLATAATGLVTGFAALLVLRVLLGLGESAAFPCSSKLIGKHLPQHQMGAANALILLGTSLGPAFGVFFGGLMMAKVGWRPSFLLFGLLSLLWLVPWLLSTRRSPETLAADAAADAADPRAPSFAAIVVRREAWGAGLGHFCLNYAFYFVVSWLPLYLVKARGFSMSHMAILSGEIYLVYAASLAVLGWLNDRLIAAGHPVELVRKGFIAIGFSIVAASFMVSAVADAQTAVAALFVAGFGFGFIGPSNYALGQTLAGPHAAGKWMGFQNGVGNVAGIVCPLITGWIVDRTGSFSSAFGVAAAMALAGIVCWCVVVRRVEPLKWAAA